MKINNILKSNISESLNKENIEVEDFRLNDLKKRFENLGETVEKTKKEKQTIVEDNVSQIKRMIE